MGYLIENELMQPFITYVSLVWTLTFLFLVLGEHKVHQMEQQFC